MIRKTMIRTAGWLLFIAATATLGVLVTLALHG